MCGHRISCSLLDIKECPSPPPSSLRHQPPSQPVMTPSPTSCLLLLLALQQCQAFTVMEGWHQLAEDHDPGHEQPRHQLVAELEEEEDERSNNNENPADWVVVGPERMGERAERMEDWPERFVFRI